MAHTPRDHFDLSVAYLDAIGRFQAWCVAHDLNFRAEMRQMIDARMSQIDLPSPPPPTTRILIDAPLITPEARQIMEDRRERAKASHARQRAKRLAPAHESSPQGGVSHAA